MLHRCARLSLHHGLRHLRQCAQPLSQYGRRVPRLPAARQGGGLCGRHHARAGYRGCDLTAIPWRHLSADGFRWRPDADRVAVRRLIWSASAIRRQPRNAKYRGMSEKGQQRTYPPVREVVDFYLISRKPLRMKDNDIRRIVAEGYDRIADDYLEQFGR